MRVVIATHKSINMYPETPNNTYSLKKSKSGKRYWK